MQSSTVPGTAGLYPGGVRQAPAAQPCGATAVAMPSLHSRPATADGDTQPRLFCAARDGDTTAVKRALAAGGVDLNAIDPDTRLSALMLAARNGHDDIVLVLCKGAQGADVNLQNSRGESALSLAAAAGHGEVMDVLLAKGARIDQPRRSGRTPLGLAVARGHLAAVEFLIARGAQLNPADPSSHPPLCIAAGKGNMAMVDLLLQKGANPELAGPDGWSAFNHAASNGHAGVAERVRTTTGPSRARSHPARPRPRLPLARTRAQAAQRRRH
jgi:ankyrin repeat protein